MGDIMKKIIVVILIGLYFGALSAGPSVCITFENILEFKDIHKKNADGWTPFLCAVATLHKGPFSRLEMVKRITKNKNLSATGTEGMTPLMVALRWGKEGVAEYVWENIDDRVIEEDINGNIALEYAARYHPVLLKKMMKKSKIGHYIGNHTRLTLFEIAVVNGNIESMIILLPTVKKYRWSREKFINLEAEGLTRNLHDAKIRGQILAFIENNFPEKE